MFETWTAYATAQDELYWAYDRARAARDSEVEQGALEQAYFALMHHLASYYPPAGIKKQRLSDEELQRLQRCLVLPRGGIE